MPGLPGPAPKPNAPTGTEFLNLVEQQIGTPYVWGGDQPGGFDCSGLAYWAAHALGISNFPRTSQEQWQAVDRIKANDLQPGDLIFMNFPGEASPGHVVIYRGGDSIVQAPSTGQLVQEDSFHAGTAQAWGAQIVGYGRIPGLNYAGEPVTTNLGSGGTTTGGAGASGGSGGGQSFWDKLLENSAIQSLSWLFPGGSTPLSEAEAKGGAGSGAQEISLAGGVAGIAAALGHMAEAVDWLMQPNHWTRIICGVGGGILVLGGTFQLFHAGSQIPVSAYGVSTSVGVPQSAALPLGIFAVGLGGVLLFVAFHNLPAGIGSFPDFLGYLSDEITIGGAKANAQATGAS